MAVRVEHYTADRVDNPNPRGRTSRKTFDKVRLALVAACRQYGVVGPEDDTFDPALDLDEDDPDFDPTSVIGCDLYVVDDQYNDELYQYVEVYTRRVLSAAWLRDVMAVLGRFPGWAIGVKNVRFAYLLVFTDKLMVTGHAFDGCDDLESVAAAASAGLWGVKGEPDPFTNNEYNRDDLAAAEVCGCYRCRAMFPPSAIVTWKDEIEEGDGQTAVCPQCGDTTVIAPKPSFTMTPAALRRVSELAFGPRPDLP
jgi:hypothetical protein